MKGIYKITIGPKFYYGQSVHLPRRRREHLLSLENNKHSNRYMQYAWDKYKDFIFEIIEIVDDASLLNEREQHYIDLFYSNDNCMNLARFAESPTRGCKMSDESKAKMSTAKCKSVQVTYSDGSIEVFVSVKEVALKFSVSTSTIESYCTGKNPQPGTKKTLKVTKHINGYTFQYADSLTRFNQ